MAWKPEVKVDGKWCRNSLAFKTEQEAKNNASDLMFSWMNVSDSRAVEVLGAPATHSYEHGVLAHFEVPVPMPWTAPDDPE